MEGDSRVTYIANIVGAIFGTNQFQQDVLASPKVQEFLNDLNCTSLECVTNGSKIKFILNSFNNIEQGYQDVHFLKRQLAEITASNIADQLLVSTMRHSPTDSLYQYMKAVYEPLLVGDSSTPGNMNPQMKNLVTSLKAGLATTLRLGASKRSADDENKLEGILSPIDEIEFWSDMEKMNVQSGADERLQKKAEKLNQHFSKLAKPLYEIDTMKLVKVNDLIDVLYDTMDYVWTDVEIDPPYGELRMKHFMKISTATLCAKVEKELNELDVWTSSFSDIRMKLNECMKICKVWKDKMADLTSTLWKQESNKWTGGTYFDPYLERLIVRLNEIFDLRSQHDELMRLLSPEDQSRLNVESAFDPFRSINCFHHNDFQSSQWNRALAKYHDNLEPMENELCDKLRKEIFAEKCEPTQRLREFQRWKGLLNMAKIKEQLKGERSSLLTELTSYISNLSADFESKIDSKSVDRPPLVNNMSRIVNDIVWARQLTSSKVQATQKVAESLFADLDGIDTFKSACKDLVTETREYEKRLFNKWLTEIQNLLKNKKESLELTGRIMEIDIASGMLKVKYNEKKIVTLIKDVRQLNELGYNIPKQLTQIIENVRKFYREGVTLRQVANHFNNMSTQIMECHNTMLLNHTIAFEKIIKSKSKDGKDAFGKEANDITWTSPVELEEYIQEVQEASNVLIKENRKVRKMHMNVIEYIVSMMNIDLLKNKDMWKEKFDMIKRIIDSSGYEARLTKVWRVHLDFQLYKAIETQYQSGLKNLNENFNMIEADLVYLDKTVSFRPPLEQLKAMYYKEISNFIDFPIKFSGLGGKPSIFKVIPNRNPESLLQVYAKADEVFSRLDNMINTFVPWTTIGYFDLETYIEEHFKDVKDWENNFKMLRLKRKQLEKLNESYKIDSFFNIRTEPFKKGIEDLFHRTHDILKNTLKAAIKADMEEIDHFIDDGMKKLNARPQSVEEIGAAKAAAVEISGKKNQFVELYNQCEERNRVLQQVSGEGAYIGEMQNRWENFDVALNAFSSMIDEQKNVLKQETDKRISTLNSELEKTFNRWEALKPKERSDMDRETAMETSEKMKEWREKWDELETKIKSITADCEHFGMEKPQFAFYEELKNDLAKQEASWRMYDEFYKELAELGKEDWLSFSRGKGIYQFQDFNDKWAEKIKHASAGMEGGVEMHASVKKLLNQAIDHFREAWPLFKICVGEAFEKEHWRGLFYMLEFPKEVNVENLKFIHFLDHIENMVKKQSEIRDLGARAQGEVSLREAIQELRAWCDQTEFSLTEYVGANNRTVPLIKDWKELMNQVSDNQSLLISLKESRFFSRFSDQVEQFESKLTGIDEYLQKLNVIQRKWVYLEPIFIRGALPAEQARFNRVDSEYVSIMMGIGMNPKVVALCDIQGLKETLDTILSQLDVCQKALNDYLEEKRSRFPRFYFIGDDDLLEILGQATNPTVIQTHLKKLFAGIHRVDFSKDSTAIVAMKSSAGEVVELSSPVQITEEVETWLSDLVNEMRQTLNLILKTTLNTTNLDIVNTPSQICCLSEMIHFSNNTIQAVKKGKLSNYKIDLQKNLESYTSFDHAGDMLLLSKLKALTLDIIHNIETVDLLINTGVKNTSQWGWYKQLKYSIDPRRDICNVGMCDAIFDYTFEYQGNAPKLVHTPLTDKCYLTLTQGMKMGYGGNPYGPAGTGKTESVKALGQAFGRQVLVFNCDEGIDFKSMGRIFIGLVKCGAWGCFDEFNRLLEEQLSAISQQIQVIQWAIKQGEPTLELLNRTIEVNKNAGIFVTMNPAGKGYGGRSKLPDNLKQLFRPVAMSAPDNELIAEVLLFAEGFKNSKQLAQKLIPLFTLSKQLLSTQQHYDWGLRALKTILTVGGQLIQKEKAKKKDLGFNEEALLLIKAIRINTMSKLTFGDSKKFEFLLNDMFPGIKVEDIIYEDLEKAIHATLAEQNLESNPKQLSKMLQFHEATNQRMGVVIVGPSGCGKSTIWKVLKKAYEKLGIHMSTHVMNPKSMPRQQLLGVMDHDTREFKDGVLTESARQVVKEPQETRCWIICDGDIDPEWIESLNSVLDDNHLLTLPNGERISFGDNVNFIFESDNLKFASPATVSRMGMIFLSEEDVNVSRLIHTWVRKQDDENMKNKLEAWMDEIFYKALDWVLKNEDKWIIETTKVGIVHNVLCSLNKIDTKAGFVDGIIRGLGGNLNIATRKELAQMVFQLSNERPADVTNVLNNYYDPKTSSFKSFVFDYKDQAFGIEDMKNLHRPPLVPTISAQRDAQMIEGWFENDKPFILVGPEGCGKNIIINSVIRKLRSTSVATIHCNAQTSAFHVIQKLNQMCTQSSKSQGRVYRPKESQKLVIYLKDINLPKPDKYDTIQLIAFLHQIVCYNGFYDENLEFVFLERIQIIASMTPATVVGRHKLSCRFTANVCIAYIEDPPADELEAIYAIYLKTILSHENFGGGAMCNSSKKIARF